MNKKTTGIIAGAAGAALLLAGSTFALWSDSGKAPGGVITSGNLDVDVVSTQWKDVSADRADSPHDIDLAKFKIVPGDTIQGEYAVDAGLEGDNLVANLALKNGGALTGALKSGLVDVEYTVLDADRNEVATGSSTGVDVTLASSDNSAPGTLAKLPSATDGTSDFTVVVSVTFDQSTSDRDLVQAQAELAGSSIQLKQVRA